MTNYKASADKFVYIVPESGSVKSGGVVISGGLIGIAATDGAEGDAVACVRSGAFELPKASGAITQGAACYWDASAGNVTTTESTNTKIGAAAAAAASGDESVVVILGA